MRFVVDLVAIVVCSVVVSGCIAVQTRTGELFVVTKRQFSIVSEAAHVDAQTNPFAVLAPFGMVGGFVAGITYAPLVDLVNIPSDLELAKKGKVIFVCDQDGCPASNVKIELDFTFIPDRISGVTDTNGYWRTGRNIDLNTLSAYHLSGKDYYSSKWKKSQFWYFKDLSHLKFKQGEVSRFTIKRKKKTCQMTYGRLEYPKCLTGNIIPNYDCEMADWLPPYGAGRHADLKIEQIREEGKDQANYKTNSLVITALGEFDGFCLRQYDLISSLGSDLKVHDNADFTMKKIEFRYVYDKQGNWLREQSRYYDERQYFIMRLRSRGNQGTDSARYGKLVFVRGLGSLAQTFLNVQENEKSLESSREWFLSEHSYW